MNWTHDLVTKILTITPKAGHEELSSGVLASFELQVTGTTPATVEDYTLSTSGSTTTTTGGSGQWNTSGTNLLSNSSFLKVGIHNSDPQYPLDIKGITRIVGSSTLGNDVLQLHYPSLVGGKNHYMFFANRYFTGGGGMFSVIGAYNATSNSTGSSSTEGPRPLILQPQSLGGNLGVGYHVKPPESKLSVIGDFYTSLNAGIGAEPHDQVQLRVTGKKSVGLCIEHNYTENWGYGLKTIVNNNNTKAIAIVNNTIDVFKIMGDGRIYATEINIRLTPFPDYVFDDNYKLTSIDSLEAYIDSEKHLPNIPSASSLNNDEIGLGELTRLQQEKIEELTLYIIELNKRLAAVENKL